MKAKGGRGPKKYQPTELSVTERASKVKVAESVEEGKGFLMVDLEVSISSKW